MECIRDVRKAIDSYNELFEPLQHNLTCLKNHGVDISSLPRIVSDKTVQDYLDEAPMMWDAVLKKTFRKKEEIMSIQLQEMTFLKEDLENFFMSIREFRNNFRSNAPFSFTGTPSEAYKLMDEHASQLVAKEIEAKAFNEKEELFELQISKYQETNDTRTELKLLKYVWDMKALVIGYYYYYHPYHHYHYHHHHYYHYHHYHY